MFRSLHPGPDCGDGQQILKSRYEFPTDKPDNFIRCAQCGWIKDMDKFQEGDTLLTPGISYNAPIVQTVKLPAYGSQVQKSFTETIVEPNVVGGCPLCGSFNSYGRFIGDPFDSGIDIANL